MLFHKYKFCSAVVPALILFFTAAAAAQTATVRGSVTSQVNGEPVAGATVQITQNRRSVETNDQGGYEFTQLEPGRYTLVTHADGYTDQVRTITLAAGEALTSNFAISLTAIREEVTVTASGTEESVFESFQSVNSVGATQIREHASTGIGEVLEREAGVGKRSFGPGTSRPVIRGFDGDRVLVLQDGARNGSLSSQSADHGEPIDALSLERLEVIKGPATLLYGSNAIGGVVNAVTTDEDDPHEGIRGVVTGLVGSNPRQGGVSGGLEYGFGKMLAKFNANTLRERDYKTPLGEIPNSASRGHGFGASLGYFGEKGFLVGSFNLDRRRYGVPYAPLFEEGALLTDKDGKPCEVEEEEDRPAGKVECQYDVNAIQALYANSLPAVPEEEIDLQMRRNNYRVRGGFRNVGGPIERGNFTLDWTRYRHEEVETADGIDEVATRFFNDTFSYRAMFEQARHKRLTGRFGFEGFSRNYETIGAEQLIDGEVRQKNFAVFGLQEIDLDPVSISFGGRIETNRYDPANAALYDNRNFTGFSGSAAARFRLWDGAAFIANFTSASRSPALEELYNEGAHIGTVTFEIGDQGLRRERSTGVEFSLRQRLNRVRLNGSFFYYKMSDFIFISPADEDGDGLVDVEDNLPVGLYRQADARFMGADASLDVDVRSWLGFFAVADVVKAELRASGTPLPRITPARARLGFDIKYKGLSVRPEAVFVGRRGQGDIFTLETPTAGYGLFNMNASYTITGQHAAHIFSFASSNLGDRLYRNHLSFIKDLAPEPGRGIKFSYTLRFF